MTIGMGVLASETELRPDHVILMADTKGSFGNDFSTGVLHKLFADPILDLYAVAADHMDQAAELFKTIHLFLRELWAGKGYGGIFQAVHAASDVYKRVRFKYDVLPKYAHIPESIPDNFTDEQLGPALLEEWRNFYFGCQMIVSSFDLEGKAYLFTIDGTGEVINCTFPGFSAIGSGMNNALFWLSYRNHNLGAPIKRAAYHAFEAKIMAEKSPFVNEEIDMVIAKKGHHFILTKALPKPQGTPVTVAELREMFSVYGPKVTDDLK